MMKKLSMTSAIVSFALCASIASAQSGGPYVIVNGDIGPASKMSGGAYQATVAFAQLDSGAMSGGVYRVGGGFWGVDTNTPVLVQRAWVPIATR